MSSIKTSEINQDNFMLKLSQIINQLNTWSNFVQRKYDLLEKEKMEVLEQNKVM